MDDVFEAFRNCISDGKCTNMDCPYESKCRIANGKDQYLQIPKHLALDVLNELKENPEIVRCKDCKYVGFKWKEDGKLFCNAPSGIGASGGSFEPNFFCAGGSRKDG